MTSHVPLTDRLHHQMGVTISPAVPPGAVMQMSPPFITRSEVSPCLP